VLDYRSGEGLYAGSENVEIQPTAQELYILLKILSGDWGKA